MDIKRKCESISSLPIDWLWTAYAKEKKKRLTPLAIYVFEYIYDDQRRTLFNIPLAYELSRFINVE